MVKRNPNCKGCNLHKTAETVCLLGKGKRTSEVMIVGEAPGKSEDEKGIPFVGRTGSYLKDALILQGISKAANMHVNDFFYTNAVSCRPPENRTPKKGEIKACKVWLNAQMEEIEPKFVLLLGNVPLESVLGLKGIKKFRGKPVLGTNGIIYLPTYHPSMVFRFRENQEVFESDLRLFAEIIEKGHIPYEEGLNHRIVRTRSDVEEMLEDLYGSVSYDIETKNLYPWAPEAGINSLGWGTKTTQWTMATDEYVGTSYDKGEKYSFSRSTVMYVLETLAKRIQDGELKLTAQNGKFDMLYTWVRYGVKFSTEFDTMMAHYMLDENSRHSLKYLSQIYFGAIDYDVDLDTKLGKKGFIPLSFYQAHDLYYTRKLKFIFKKRLEKDFEVNQVFNKVIMPCVNLFTEIEHRGFFIQKDKFNEAESYLRGEIQSAESELVKYIPKHYKGQINWGSPKQLAKLLFEDLGIEIVEKTAKGSPSTSESVLKRIDHPMVSALLKLRGAKQQLSFFIEGWKPFLDGNRLHPNFKLHGTVTGRLSCEHPNLQQVPRDPRIRTLISAPPGWSLIEADLSQIELRIAAELSNDRGLLYAFLNKLDPHWYTCLGEIKRGGAMPDVVLKTASVITGAPVKNFGDACQIVLEAGSKAAEEVNVIWKELRKKAKAVNFGYLYGMWWKKFRDYARDNYGVIVTDKQAQQSRENYFATYPDLPEWHKRQKAFVRANGYVRSLSGRKRRLPAALDPFDGPERQAAERQAINSPVQSFANELNLMAGIQLSKEFSPKVFQVVGTVHDALLMETRNDYVERVYNRTLEVMSHPQLLDDMGILIRVPIEAEAKIGPWAAGVSLDKWLENYNGK